MTRLFIEGKEAALQDSFSFEYITENPDFTDAEAYSLDITLPLRGCTQNEQIFPDIERLDIYTDDVRFDAVLIAEDFYKEGVVTVISIADDTLKVQFLEGRSVRNFDHNLNNIYINELQLGHADCYAQTIKPYQAWRGLEGEPLEHGLRAGIDYVALPWTNQGSGMAQNEFTDPNEWKNPDLGLSWQPYLIILAKRIASAAGLSHDFSVWEKSPMRFLLCFNALPAVWQNPDFAKPLPHWSVNEFFRQIEYITGFTFLLSGTYIKCVETIKEKERTGITELKNVLEAFTASVSADDKNAGFIGAKNIRFADRGDQDWKRESCRTFLEQWNPDKVMRYDTFDEMVSVWQPKINVMWDKKQEPDWIDSVIYAQDIDTWFALRKYALIEEGKTLPLRLTPLNRFGEYIRDTSTEAAALEIKIVPVRVCEGPGFECAAINVAGYAENENEDRQEEALESEERQPLPLRMIDAGNSETPEYLDKLYVGFWRGYATNDPLGLRPLRDRYEFMGSFSYKVINIPALRPCDPEFPIRAAHDINIDTQKEYTIKFISDGLPDVKNTFIIQGVPYLCKKITVKFDNFGMSQLKTGIFYRILS